MKKIVTYILLLILLLEIKFFYIISLPQELSGFNTYNNKVLILILMLIGLIIFFIDGLKFGLKKRLFNKEVIGLLIIYLIQVCSSCFVYNQGFIEVIKASYYFFIPLLYYLLISFLDDEKKYRKLFRIIILFSSILSFLFIIQSIAYEEFGIIFLKLEKLSGSIFFIRNNRIRLIQPALIISFSLILSWAELIKLEKKNDKLLYVYNIIFGLIYLILVCQTRMLTLSVITSMLAILLLKRKSNIKQLTVIIFIINLFLFIYNINFTKNFIQSFDATDFAWSMHARTEALNYYIEKIINNPIIPIGLLNEANNLERFYIIHGKQGYLYESDVGIVGLAVTLGVVGLVWFILLIIKLFRIIIYVYRKKKLNEYIELVGIITFVIINVITLIITDIERIICLPVILAIFEHVYIRSYDGSKE